MAEDAELVLADAAAKPSRRGLVVLLVVFLVAAIGLGVVAANRVDDQASGPAPSLLIGSDWGIDSVSIDGKDPIEPTPSMNARIAFDGEQMTAEGCNTVGGDATVGAGTVAFGKKYFSTAVGCFDPARSGLDTAFGHLVAGRSATWTIEGDALRLEGGGVLILAHVLQDTFPSTPGFEVLSASNAGVFPQWRLGFTEQPADDVSSGYFLSVEGRDEPATAFGSAGMAVDTREPLGVMWFPLADRLLVFGSLPEGTAYVEFHPEEEADGLPATGLRIFTLPDGRPVFGEPVDGMHGVIRAFGHDDKVIAESRRLGA